MRSLITGSITAKTKGFTLGELLIVVAIVSVLVAISIPIFTSKMDKSKEAVCSANRRSLKAELTNDYMDGSEFAEGETISEAKLREKYGKNFDFDTFCPKHGKITAEFNGTSFIIYCSVHGNKFMLGDKDTMKSILDIMAESGRTNLDSGALKNNSSFASKINEALKNAGIDLEALGASSWRYRTGSKLLYWSSYDISKIEQGKKLPVMRYNSKTGTYTVWIATIGEGSSNNTTYNIIGTDTQNDQGIDKYTPSTSQSSDKQTYENASELYKQALKEYGY